MQHKFAFPIGREKIDMHLQPPRKDRHHIGHFGEFGIHHVGVIGLAAGLLAARTGTRLGAAFGLGLGVHLLAELLRGHRQGLALGGTWDGLAPLQVHT